MNFIKNTYKALKKNPRVFMKIGTGLADISMDMTRMRAEGVSHAMVPLTLRTISTLVSNFIEARDEIRDADKISVTIDPDDEITQDVLASWSSDEVDPHSFMDYSTKIVGSEDGLDVAFVPAPGSSQKLKLPNGNYAELLIENVTVQKNGREISTSSMSYNIFLDNEDDYISFTESLTQRIKDYAEPSDRPLRLFTNSTYGFSRKELPRRAFESVILKYGQADYLTTYLDKFFNNKEMYDKKGFIHRTGILFYGPPGTGKTSIATAIANKYKRNVYQVQLSAVSGDDELVSLFSEIPGGTVVLLEDIDVAVRNRKDNSEDSGISLASLLNVIDGNFAPDDTLFIMTTNDKNSLDPALTRPGRADLHVKVDFLDNEQLARMCDYYLGFIPENIPDISSLKIEPAKVVSIFREHVLDVDLAAKDLIKELTKEVSID